MIATLLSISEIVGIKVQALSRSVLPLNIRLDSATQSLLSLQVRSSYNMPFLRHAASRYIFVIYVLPTLPPFYSGRRREDKIAGTGDEEYQNQNKCNMFFFLTVTIALQEMLGHCYPAGAPAGETAAGMGSRGLGFHGIPSPFRGGGRSRPRTTSRK